MFFDFKKLLFFVSDVNEVNMLSHVSNLVEVDQSVALASAAKYGQLCIFGQYLASSECENNSSAKPLASVIFCYRIQHWPKVIQRRYTFIYTKRCIGCTCQYTPVLPCLSCSAAFSALTLLVGQQKGIWPIKN